MGYDHFRHAIRTFRLTRIQGSVRFVTEKARDFNVPPDYDPEKYKARPPWLVGKVVGTATLKVDEDLSWWVARLEPHVEWLREDDNGCGYFSVPFADEEVLLSWVVGLGGCGELLGPVSLREKLVESLIKVLQAHEGTPIAVPSSSDVVTKPRGARTKSSTPKAEPIAPEHLARAISLMQFLVDERRAELIPWQLLEADLGLSREEVEADLSLINLVNFGGGTYTLFAEAGDQGVTVTRELMADTFARPARLSPLMTRALLLAFDLLGEAVTMDSTESLASVRHKILLLAGSIPDEAGVVVDDVMPASPGVMEVLNRSIREHTVVQIEYFTPTRGRLAARRVEPYLLFRSRDGWYLEAYCLNARAQRTFRLEFIRSAKATKETFSPRAEVDLDARRSGSAFTTGTSVEWATVLFAPRRRPYLEDRGIAFESLPDGTLQSRIPYLDEQWMAREIIRFLGDAVLQTPEILRERIRESAASLLQAYSEPTGISAKGLT